MFHCRSKYAKAVFSVFVIAFGAQSNAASAIGQASATVISSVVSTPVEFRFQIPQLLSAQGAPTVSSFVNFQSSGGGSAGGGPSATSQSNESLVSVDANGVVSFSVSGDATSSYAVRPAGGDGGGMQTQTTSTTGTTPSAANVAGGLIVPAQALTGGGRLSIQISQASVLGEGGGMIIEISYN